MTSIRESIRRMFAPHQPLPPGMYHYQTPPDAPKPYRLHLRLENDGSGILVVNAATVLHLNHTAAEYVYHLIKETPQDQVIHNISTRYHVNRAQAIQDYKDIVTRIQTLIDSPDLDPVTYLDFERYTPYTQEISAPYRLDCALTYRLSPGTTQEAAPTDRVKRELSADEWRSILDKAWAAGIPHVTFTGGEPTLRDDLPDLISYTESKGPVCGLMTDGLRLADASYLNTLLQTGLDHALIILQPELEQTWTALENALAADLFVAVHFTLTPQNSSNAAGLLERLAKMGVKAISLSANTHELHNSLMELRNHAARLGLSLVWDLPVPYSATHPVALEISGQEDEQTAQGAGHAWLYVEPDGDVLPAQGITQVMGNFLTDPWEKIWANKPA